MKWRFGELRLQHGFTQEEFRQKFNAEYEHTYTPAAISLFENGKRLPTLRVIMEMAEFFGVSLDYLMGRTETTESKESTITALEKLHLSKYRSLSSAGRAIVDATLEAVFQQEHPIPVAGYEKRETS